MCTLLNQPVKCSGVCVLKSVIKLGQTSKSWSVRWIKKFSRWASVEEKNRKPRKYTCLYIRCTEWSQISSVLVRTKWSLIFPSPVLELVCDVEIRFNHEAM